MDSLMLVRVKEAQVVANKAVRFFVSVLSMVTHGFLA